MIRRPPRSTPFPTRRSSDLFFRLHAMRWSDDGGSQGIKGPTVEAFHRDAAQYLAERGLLRMYTIDRKSTRLNSSHLVISYAVFCLKKKIHRLMLVFFIS